MEKWYCLMPEIGVKNGVEFGSAIGEWSRKHINIYQSMRNWRKIGVKVKADSRKPLKILNFLGGK